MNASFYDDPQLNDYNLIAICAEDTKKYNKGKFYIPALTPFLDRSEPYIKTDKLVKTSNILNNKENLDIVPCNTSNYVELLIPDNLGEIKKDEKVMICFLNKDIQNPVILGRYLE